MQRYSLIFLIFLACCGQPEYSPWQSNIEYKGLTNKHLAWLSSLNKDDNHPLSIILAGDPQAVVGHLRSVIEKSNQIDSDFVVILGDNTDLGLRREWIWIGDTIEKSNKPVLTVVGNHDGLTKGKQIYQKMFGPLNYSFVYRDIKFVMWNNNYYEWGTPDFDWLENEVLSYPKVVVMSHQPPYALTLLPSHEERWKRIRAHPNYIASLHGHQHSYAYSYEKDTDTQIYTVDRVSGTHYGIMTFNEDGISFQNCTPTCYKIEESQ
jgi:3',5'-cyclic AMP phosphodiesterase CpdA